MVVNKGPYNSLFFHAWQVYMNDIQKFSDKWWTIYLSLPSMSFFIHFVPPVIWYTTHAQDITTNLTSKSQDKGTVDCLSVINLPSAVEIKYFPFGLKSKSRTGLLCPLRMVASHAWLNGTCCIRLCLWAGFDFFVCFSVLFTFFSSVSVFCSEINKR